MNIALVGWGLETKSAYKYYGPGNDYLIVSEEPRDDLPNDSNVNTKTNSGNRPVGQSGNATDLSYLEGLEGYDLIVYSPTARKNLETIYPKNSPFWAKAKSILNEFFEKCPSKNIIGITGTKGKGTTTTLIAKMLEADGQIVHVGGNIGIPVLDLLESIKQDDWVVLELSSFQLYKFPYSPHIAVHLMMIPEHIAEWHTTMDDYVDSKRQIFASQKETDIAVYHATNKYSVTNVQASKGQHIPYLEKPGAYVEDKAIKIDGKTIIETDEIALLGAHNIENVCAAVTASWNVHQNIPAYQEVLRNFSGLEHRLQMVRELNGVKYYDDSFGTTPDTAVVAMDAFAEPKVVIVGGHDKGNDFTPMISRLMGDDISKIICLGPTGKFISDALVSNGVNKGKIVSKDDVNDWTMDSIVDSAKSSAEIGDIVLLSTGSASFGIFKDYKERGNQFIDSVNNLA